MMPEKPKDLEVTLEETNEPWQIKLAKQLGLPTVFLLILLYFIYQAGTWIAHSIAMPLFEKQTKFIDKATDMMSDMSDTLRDNQTTSLRTQSDVDALSEVLKQQTEVLKSIDNTLKGRP
jgi:hypothetical protein